MKEYKPRNLEEVANKIIKVIEEKCDFNEGRIIDIIEQIEKVKNSSRYRAPEFAYLDWNYLADILSKNFVPSNSKWETEIMIIFNDLNGSVDDYFEEVK